MPKRKNDYGWLLLFALAAGAWLFRPAVTVTATDPATGEPVRDLSEQIAAQAAFEGMTVPEFLAGLDAESRATGVPVAEILRGIGIA